MTGTYTEIVEIIAPSSAVAGETVNVEVRVKNLHTGPIYITATGNVNGLDLYFGAVSYIVPAGSIQSFYDAFIMPDRGVRVYAWSWYWGDDDWQVVGEGDDEAYKDIVLPEEVELELLEVKINPVGVGYVTVTPTPISGVQHLWYFEHGTLVAVTAHPYMGYKFKSWSGEMTDTTAITAPVYPMTEKRTITAHFEEEVAEVETLNVDILPLGKGYVTTNPASEEGKTTWHAGDTGTFPYGTKVKVTAHPEAGYFFDYFSGEIIGGVSYDNPSYVQDMTEHRRITCHFRTEEENLETLRVDITPVGTGHVITDPASEEGRTEWHNGDTGTFPYGTQVKVTAIPVGGYRFEKWSDEIVGGVSYNNPFYVQDMTEHRAVKCHFREVGEEPIFLDFKIEAVDDQPVPLVEIITKGVGETLKVSYSFKYKVPNDSDVRIWASLYKYSAGIIDRQGQAQTKEIIALESALDWKDYVGEIDIIIGDMPQAIYGLILELPDDNIEDRIDDSIEVSAPPSIWDAMLPLLAIGLLAGIMMPMMKE